MIIVENVDEGTRERRYSDKDVMIKQIETGNLYEDAVDVIPCKYTYEETEESVMPEQVTQYQSLSQQEQTHSQSAQHYNRAK